ncbi:zinc metalloproteinase-disintegrin-like MTP8 [Arctopsyche grandis]|uniref:zinc metalloproteinase-disintegrin-like MTP8 n=1 Tax=Arctopsyche grandis TaxID=121162 RepID=UPI00406D7412
MMLWTKSVPRILLILVSVLEIAGQPSADFRRHTIVHPKIFHGKEKRQISTTLQQEGLHAHTLTISYDINGEKYLLDLHLNRELIPSNFFVRHQLHGKHIVQNSTELDIDLCQYVGKIRGIKDSWVALSTCRGLSGVVYDGKTMHFLQPGKENNLDDAHFLYRHDDLVTNHKCGYVGRHNESESSNPENEFKSIPRHKRAPLSAGSSIRGPYNANEKSRYLELVMVVDNTEYKALGNLTRVYQRCKEMANIAYSLYAPLNIFIALVGVVVWTEHDEIELSPNVDNRLNNFLHYRRQNLAIDHPNDNAQLLTRVKFDGEIVGKGLKGPMCTYEFSGGIILDHSAVVGLVATTMVHELGHTFGMEHDTEYCDCPDKQCIMNPISQIYTHWSSCSSSSLAMAFEHGMDYCLRNKPKTLFEFPTCGNGFVEPGEECDCGSSKSCDGNNCCNPTTCMLYANATCATGKCCNVTTCQLSKAGTICRSADYECDLPEFCSGQSEYCPDDVFKMDTSTCEGGSAFCYQGTCRTRTDQCKLLWGPTGKDGDDKCYLMNKSGTRNGNCGYNLVTKIFSKCEDENIFCGILHCSHLNERLEFGMESVAILSHSFINKEGSIIPCRTVIVDLGLDQVDPGLVPNGAKCGDGKMCVNQKCVTLDSLRLEISRSHENGICPSNCSGHGVCNSLGHCHCDTGFAPPLCNHPGPGGSSDSGPANLNHFVEPEISTTEARPTSLTESYLNKQCTLPPFPKYGNYSGGQRQMFPGVLVDRFVLLIYSCDAGFGFRGPNIIYCTDNGTWSDEVQCLKLCKPLQSFTVDFKCLYKGEILECDKPLPDGTTVTTSCKEYHKPTFERHLKILTCTNGEWDKTTPKCIPDCGQVVEGIGNIIGTQMEAPGGSPWHVGIYYTLDKNDAFSQICGGTIISTKIVISAAHCFEIAGRIQSEQNYAVAAGKYYRNWEDVNDESSVQKSDIEKIRVPTRYGGHKYSLQEDLAVLILKTPFNLNNFVHAICIDIFDHNFNELQLRPKNLGKVVGWGITQAGNVTSTSLILKVAEIPVVEYDQCVDGIPEEFRKYITSDKFCAGFLDKGTTVCSGDSGGGIVFKTIEKGVTRWYIRGVVSAGALDDSRTTCRPNSYTLFTNVFFHNFFLTNLIKKYR